LGQIGNTLREARLRLGLSLTDAQKATKVRARYLEALEQERFRLLPDAVYARGFLRAYAELLELDPEPLLDELALALTALAPPPAPPPPARRVAVPRRALAVGGTLVALVAGLALVGLDLESRTPPPVPPAPLPAAAQPSLPRPTAAVAPVPVRPAVLVLAAIRGNCWLSVRRDSAAGALVWQGLLRRGSSLRLGGLPLWVRMGAPWNLAAKLGKRALAELPTAPRPANVLVTAAGAAPA
jgi:cytoskeleton protein RodZ